MNARRLNRYRALWQIPAVVMMACAMGLLCNALRPDGLPLVGNWSRQAPLTTASGELLSIGLEAARGLFADNTAVFIDARDPEAYAEGHIRGAVNLPWHEVEERFVEVADSLDPERLIITYCDGQACSLSKDLALFLQEMGFGRVRVLVNGWGLWQEHGLPAETGEGGGNLQ